MRELLWRQVDILLALARMPDYQANEQEFRFLWQAFENVLSRQDDRDLVAEQKRLLALQKQEPLDDQERQGFYIEAQKRLCLQQIALLELTYIPKNDKPVTSHISRLSLLAQFNDQFKAPVRLSVPQAGMAPTKIKSVDALLTWLFQFANPHAPFYVSAARVKDAQALCFKFSVTTNEIVDLTALRLWFKAVIIRLSAIPNMPAFECSDPESIDQSPVDWIKFKDKGLTIRLDSAHLHAIAADMKNAKDLFQDVTQNAALRSFPWQETGVNSKQIAPFYQQQLKEAFGLTGVASVQGCIRTDKARAGLWLHLPPEVTKSNSARLFPIKKSGDADNGCWVFHSYVACLEKLGSVFGFDAITDYEHAPNRLSEVMAALLELKLIMLEPSIEKRLSLSL